MESFQRVEQFNELICYDTRYSSSYSDAKKWEQSEDALNDWLSFGLNNITRYISNTNI